MTTSWIANALLAALFAALVGIFGKLGLQHVEVLTATTLRALVMAGVMAVALVATGAWRHVVGVSASAWVYIVLAGLAGAASWTFFFRALAAGPAVQVTSIDRLSAVITLVLAVVFLHERPSLTVYAGVGLMVLGGLLVARG